MPRALEVWSGEQLVGHLREENDIWAFEYVPEWVSSPDSYPLCPALPLEPREHVDGSSIRTVQWYFDNLLPEETLRETIAKEAKLPADDAFGFLAYYGQESAGSLVLVVPGEPNHAEQGKRLLPPEELSKRIRNLPTASLTKDAPKKMSLAGAQHKIPVVISKGELYEPLPGTPSTYILKPNHQSVDYSASVMNEYFTMRLGKAVGLSDVPDVLRMYVPEPVYLVKRFDRVEEKTGRVKRLHAIDTCQLLNKPRQFKYNAANLDSLIAAINECRQVLRARIELYKWLVFNCLIGNSDNHLKNISFLVDHEGVRIAPAYDLLSTAVYETKALATEGRVTWPDTELALSLGETVRFSGVNREALLNAGIHLGLPKGVADRHLDQILRRLPVEAERLFEEIKQENTEHIERAKDRGTVGAYLEAEMRLLRSIMHIIIPDMMGRVK